MSSENKLPGTLGYALLTIVGIIAGGASILCSRHGWSFITPAVLILPISQPSQLQCNASKRTTHRVALLSAPDPKENCDTDADATVMLIDIDSLLVEPHGPNHHPLVLQAAPTRHGSGRFGDAPVPQHACKRYSSQPSRFEFVAPQHRPPNMAGDSPQV